jgi:rhodanese-related sulfurtransferase
MQIVSPAQLKEWLASAHPPILIDVREDWEHANYNIGGTNIPLGELMQRKDEIPVNTTVVLYCQKGIRSGIAVQRLEALGYTNLYNMEGGVVSWSTLV